MDETMTDEQLAQTITQTVEDLNRLLTKAERRNIKVTLMGGSKRVGISSIVKDLHR